jgi:hypothetical protein
LHDECNHADPFVFDSESKGIIVQTRKRIRKPMEYCILQIKSNGVAIVNILLLEYSAILPTPP